MTFEFETLMEATSYEQARAAALDLVRGAVNEGKLKELLGNEHFRDAIGYIEQQVGPAVAKNFETEVIQASQGQAKVVYQSGIF